MLFAESRTPSLPGYSGAGRKAIPSSAGPKTPRTRRPTFVIVMNRSILKFLPLRRAIGMVSQLAYPTPADS